MNNVADHVSVEASLVNTLDPRRCQFSFADGRRCRSQRWEAHPALCLAHAREQDSASPSDWQPPKTGPYLQPARKKTAPHSEPAEMIDLAPLSGEFRTATDVNRALGKIFLLLAQNRIPRRNAVALGYLAQLLLQTLPDVREELTDCLGDEAWDETLKSALGEAQTEDGAEHKTEAEENETEDETQDDQEESTGCWRYLQPGFGQKSSRASAAAASQPDSVSPIDEPKTVIAQTEPVPLPAPVVAAPAHAEAAHTDAGCTCSPPRTTATKVLEANQTPAEIAAEPEPESLVPKPPEPYNYWRELERRERAVLAARVMK